MTEADEPPLIVHAFGGQTISGHALALCDGLRRYGQTDVVLGPDDDAAVTCRYCLATLLGTEIANRAISEATRQHRKDR